MNDYYYQQSQREKAWMAAQIKELQAKQAICEHSYRRRTTGGKRSGRQTIATNARVVMGRLGRWMDE